jgi:cellulose biosynthesis protein BcsQ
MVYAAEIFQKVYELLRQEPLWGPVAVVLPTMAFAGFWFGRFFPRSRSRFVTAASEEFGKTGPSPHELLLQRQLDEARAREANDNMLREAILSDESDLWRVYEPRPPEGYSPPVNVSRPKIIVVANNKGGVGKTTLTAALATYFERKRQKRVLLIDLDYQGSLTNWMIKAAGIHIPPDQSYRLAHANGLVDGGARRHWVAESLRNKKNAEGFATTQLVTADYSLTKHETKLMLDWLLQGGTPDIRFNVAEALLGRHVQDQDRGFDIVLIDAPPRLTTGAVGALVAATHFLVPTILDPLSAETVGSFLKQVWALRTRFNPGLELAGVVATMTTARPIGQPLKGAELDARAIATKGMEEWKARTHMFKSDIQDIAAIRKRSGLFNPYFSEDDKVGPMFDAIGDELCERIGLSTLTDDTRTDPRETLKTGTHR